MTDETEKSERTPLERIAAMALAAIFTIAAPMGNVEAAPAGGGARSSSVSSGARVSTSVNTARIASMNASIAARNAAAMNATRAATAARSAQAANVAAARNNYAASHAAQATKSANLMNSVKATLAESKAILAGKPPVNQSYFKPSYSSVASNAFSAKNGAGKTATGGGGNGGGKPPTYTKSGGSGGLFGKGNGGYSGGGYYRYDRDNILLSPTYYYMPGNIYHPIYFPSHHKDAPKQVEKTGAILAANATDQGSKPQASVTCIFTKLSQNGVGTDMKPDELQDEIRHTLHAENTSNASASPLTQQIHAAKLACE